MKKPEIFRQTLRTPAVTQIRRFIAAACAAVAVCFAVSSQASNILVNPGFDNTPLFVGWSQYTTETWSSTPNTTLYRSAPNGLWMQGLYANGGAPNVYISYDYETFACAPGSTFTADAWFSQFVLEPVPSEGGSGGSPSSGLFGANGQQEDGWIEVAFLGAAGNILATSNILADYRSFIIDPLYVANLAASGATTTNVVGGNTNAYLNWFDVQVTNQYNPATLGTNVDPDPNVGTTNVIIGTLGPSGVMTAPAGTKYVQFRINLCQTGGASGAPHWDDCTLNQVSGPGPSIISGITPSGGQFFNLTNTFSFNVQSVAFGASPLPTNPTNGIKVVVNGVDQSSSLQFNGSNTYWNVSLPNLASNTLYSISITVSNSAGMISPATANFDTFSPNSFVVAVEDYDYGSGQFIQNPIPTNGTAAFSYWGRAGTVGVDYDIYSGGTAGGGNSLEPNYPHRLNTNATDAAWQVATDTQLPLYIAQSNSAIYNVNIAYNNGGNWFNYTRTYPSGYGLIYARIAGGLGANTEGYEYLNLLTSGQGTPTQTTTNLGVFLFPNGASWNTYYWVPLTDIYGNIVSVNIPSGQQTLQLVSGGGENVISYIFAPLPAAGLPPIIKNLSPALLTGQNIFVNPTNITFTVSSLTSTIPSNNVHAYLNGVNVSATETFTGNSTLWNVIFPISGSNLIQSFAISAVDANGLSNGIAGTFDTFSQNNFMIEAGDFDFNGGQWIDNPLETATAVALTNSYNEYPGGNVNNTAEYGVDYTTTNVTTAETYLYRYDGNTPGTVNVVSTAAGTEVTSDSLRDKLINMGPSAVPPFEYVPGEAVPFTNTDFDVGWWPPGTWLNYTRTFPSNTYVIYGRLANGGPYSGATMSLVTAGRGTPSQTTQLLGTFSDANANGFQAWHWIPLMNNGTNVVVSLSGAQTLKVTAPPGSATGSINAHFYMFVPYSVIAPYSISATVSAGTVSIKIPTQSGHSYSVYYSSSLNPASWQALVTNISGDGTVKTVTDNTSGGAVRFYRVAAQ